jgi:penicillin-binding protein A
MDSRIRRLGAALLVLFLILVGSVSYVQVVAAQRIADNPANTYRQLVAEYKVDRGEILAADARTVLASSHKSKGDYLYQRRYPLGSLYGQLTGYYSLYYGRSQLEQSFNSYLSGDAPELLPQTLGDAILGRPKRGASIVTTIDPSLQKLAGQLVDQMPEGGAIAVEDPRTGNMLALASNPGFDPNPISSQNGRVARAAWTKVNRDPSTPLRARASDQSYPPGSTFKLVTASAALQNGYAPQTLIDNPPQLDLPDTANTLSNFGGGQCSGGSRISLTLALTESCDVSFGEIALDLGAHKLAAQARAYGFCLDDPKTSTACLSEAVPFDIPWTQGRFPQPSFYDRNRPLLAYSGIGQSDVSANPMQMALVASAIANHGVEMRPRLVTEIRDPQGRVIKRYQPTPWGQPISPTTSRELTQMMVDVVQSGTGTNAQIPGVSVAGKTGTAQHGDGQNPHAWFTAFAPADAPRVAVAVIVLDGGKLGGDATGGVVAAPVAKQVMEAALAQSRATAEKG